MPTGHLSRVVNVPNAQLEVIYDTSHVLGYLLVKNFRLRYFEVREFAAKHFVLGEERRSES